MPRLPDLKLESIEGEKTMNEAIGTEEWNQFISSVLLAIRKKSYAEQKQRKEGERMELTDIEN